MCVIVSSRAIEYRKTSAPHQKHTHATNQQSHSYDRVSLKLVHAFNAGSQDPPPPQRGTRARAINAHSPAGQSHPSRAAHCPVDRHHTAPLLSSLRLRRYCVRFIAARTVVVVVTVHTVRRRRRRRQWSSATQPFCARLGPDRAGRSVSSSRARKTRFSRAAEHWKNWLRCVHLCGPAHARILINKPDRTEPTAVPTNALPRNSRPPPAAAAQPKYGRARHQQQTTNPPSLPQTKPP